MTAPSNDRRQEGQEHLSTTSGVGKPAQAAVSDPILPPLDPVERANKQIEQTRRMIAYYQKQADECGLFDQFYGLKDMTLQLKESEVKLLKIQQDALEKYQKDKAKFGDTAKYEIDTRSYAQEVDQISRDGEKLYDQACLKVIGGGAVAVASVVSLGTIPAVAAALGGGAAVTTGGAGVLGTMAIGTASGTAAGTAFALAGNTLKELSKDDGSVSTVLKDTGGHMIDSLEASASVALPLGIMAKFGTKFLLASEAAKTLTKFQTVLQVAKPYVANLAIASASAPLMSTVISATEALRGNKDFWSQETAKEIAINSGAAAIGSLVGVNGSILRSGVSSSLLKGVIALGESTITLGSDVTAAKLMTSGDLSLDTWINIGLGNVTGYVTGRASRDQVEQRRTLTEKKPNPVDVKDSRTQLATKAVISSEEWCKQINETIPGDKVVVSMDFKNMGALNSNELSGVANDLLAHVPVAAEGTLPKGSVVVRTGGDELVLIMPHDSNNPEVTTKAIEGFNAAIAEKRDSLMAKAAQHKVEKTHQFVASRDALRSLLKDVPEGQHLSTEEFKQRIDGKLSEYGKSYDEISKLTVDQKLDAIAQFAYLNGTCAPESVMGLSAGSVHIGDVSPTDLYKTIAQGDKLVHDAKGTASQEAKIVEFDQSIQLRASEQAEVDGNQKLSRDHAEIVSNIDAKLKENFFADISPEISELSRISGGDPTSPGNLRQNLVTTFKTSEVFGLKSAATRQAIAFDINGFGAINNNMGTTRGDEVYNAMANIARKHFGEETTMIRRNGGELVVFNGDKPLSDAQLDSLSLEMNEAIASQMNHPAKDACVAEFQIRQALNRITGGKSESDSSLGKITLTTSDVRLTPNETVGDLFSRLNQGGKKRYSLPLNETSSKPTPFSGSLPMKADSLTGLASLTFPPISQNEFSHMLGDPRTTMDIPMVATPAESQIRIYQEAPLHEKVATLQQTNPIQFEAVQKFVLDSRRKVAEISQPGGLLDEYLISQGVDVESAKVYHIGSSSEGYSTKGESGPHIARPKGEIDEHTKRFHAKSDIDLMIDAKLLNGDTWRGPLGGNLLTLPDGSQIQVLSRNFDELVDREFGYTRPAETWDIPSEALLVRGSKS